MQRYPNEIWLCTCSEYPPVWIIATITQEYFFESFLVKKNPTKPRKLILKRHLRRCQNTAALTEFIVCQSSSRPGSSNWPPSKRSKQKNYEGTESKTQRTDSNVCTVWMELVKNLKVTSILIRVSTRNR